MLKYKRLTENELEKLENEFVKFLVLNGIVASDWEKIKANEPQKADKFIELFSDVVYESVLRKTEYLDWRSEREIRTFQCLQKEMVLVGIKLEDHVKLNLLDQQVLDKAAQDPPDGILIYTTRKEYTSNREAEIFSLIEAGAQISEGKLFKSLCLVL